DPERHHFQRAYHHRAHSAGAARRRLQTDGRARHPPAQSAHLRFWRHHYSIHRDQTHRSHHHRTSSRLTMKEFFSHIRSAVMATIVLAVICCGLYPLVIFGISQALFRDKANGSLIIDPGGTVHGSKLLAQGFTADKYFHPRPSAAGNGYDAANSSGSNLGPTSQKLNDAIKDRVAAYRKENGLSETEPVP